MDLSESMKMALSKGADPAASRNAGAGYVTEKLYMLLQLYLQNKGWNPSVELLQCFSELKDSPVLPSPAYLQVIANRVNLDSQGRLILRENGKIVLPYEHFGNAVMLKHMQGGPHGIHLSVEQTVRAVMESYTIGRENFGMEKEFIVDVVKSCPNCRYYKQQHSWESAAAAGFQGQSLNPDYLTHLQQMAAAGIDISAIEGAQNLMSSGSSKKVAASASVQQPRMSDQAQITAAIIQQQNRAMAAQQGLDKNFMFQSSASAIEKQQRLEQRQLQQYEKQHLSQPSTSTQPPPPPQTPLQPPPTFDAATLEALSSSNKDLLALHNGAWSQPTGEVAGQEKIVRTFSELMRNVARMKQFIRPSMCKPYGKQSESLQKALMDTIQIVLTIRSYLPPPHIPVSSWKSESGAGSSVPVTPPPTSMTPKASEVTNV